MRAAKFTELQIADNSERKAVKRLSEYMLYRIELTPADNDTNKENVPPSAAVPTSIEVRTNKKTTSNKKTTTSSSGWIDSRGAGWELLISAAELQ